MNTLYCEKCFAPVPEGSTHCPVCGFTIQNSMKQPQQHETIVQKNEQQFNQQQMNQQMNQQINQPSLNQSSLNQPSVNAQLQKGQENNVGPINEQPSPLMKYVSGTEPFVPMMGFFKKEDEDDVARKRQIQNYQQAPTTGTNNMVPMNGFQPGNSNSQTGMNTNQIPNGSQLGSPMQQSGTGNNQSLNPQQINKQQINKMNGFIIGNYQTQQPIGSLPIGPLPQTGMNYNQPMNQATQTGINYNPTVNQTPQSDRNNNQTIGQTQSGVSYNQPANQTPQPGWNNSQLVNPAPQSGISNNQPINSMSQPGMNYNQPMNPSPQPGMNYSQSVNPSAQPGINGYAKNGYGNQPGNGYQQQRNGYGQSVKGYQRQEPLLGEFFESDIELFVDKNARKYLERFQRVEEKGLTFHFPCAIVSIFWMIYRRMYLEAVAVFVGNIFFKKMITMLCTSIGSPMTSFGISLLSDVFVIFILGFAGYPMYYAKVKRELKKLGCNNISTAYDTGISTTLTDAGGTRARYVWCILIIFMLVYMSMLATIVVPALYYIQNN